MNPIAEKTKLAKKTVALTVEEDSYLFNCELSWIEFNRSVLE